ncbi:DUF262 domain-containing protein [Hoeflea sp. 108]|uniref:DUF262 domain-containing protein n=1 Tax=Hoeflea sp. 108 TaxID=1116369 RepID=UPI00036F73EB|nr:DUF262 domain-containing protein [Hoeflea sp. 108]
MEARTKTIEGWLSMIGQGQLALPRFQRHEAWKADQIEGVLENILRVPSLPIGALLTLEIGDEELFHSRPIVGAPALSGRPQMHLLDGQQRMTAIWRSLNDSYDELSIFVELGDDDNEPEVEIKKRWERNGVRYPVWLDSAEQVLAAKLVPIHILCPGSAGEKRMLDWCEAAKADRATERRITNLRARVAAYPTPFLSLPVETAQETALDVFIRMNTSASPLKDFDIVVAQLEGAVGNSLHTMVDELRQSVPATQDFGRIEDLALAVGALLLGKPPLKKTYLEKDFGEGLASVWPEVCFGIERGIGFLRDEAIFAEKLLPTEVAVYLVSALWARVPQHGHDVEGRARTLIRKALWRASFTDRYLKTAATRGYSDHIRLAALIANRDATEQPELFDEVANPLPSPEELARAGWPGRRDRLSRAILAVSLHRGGYDFADGAKANADNIGRREYHHLFPVGVLGVERDSPYASRALNCALITWRTNRKIAAKTPKNYLEARAADAHLGEAEVRSRLESHMVPYDALIAGDYDAFIGARAQRVHGAMMRLCRGETLDQAQPTIGAIGASGSR